MCINCPLSLTRSGHDRIFATRSGKDAPNSAPRDPYNSTSVARGGILSPKSNARVQLNDYDQADRYHQKTSFEFWGCSHIDRSVGHRYNTKRLAVY